jgi:hypothetical protein
MNFGEFCRREVNAMGKSVYWLTVQIDSSPSVIAKWRRGTKPKTEYFLLVCKILSKEQDIPLIEMIHKAAASMGIELDESNPNSHQKTKDPKK